MATTYNIEAESRSVVGKKVSQLRVQGLVPAVIYGARFDPMNVQIPYRPLEIALRRRGRYAPDQRQLRRQYPVRHHP